uniref:Uncharacterized protein n=1 Tax=Octactis speculum TaxID=3111310 RepID=A0A7S2BX14_9STRA
MLIAIVSDSYDYAQVHAARLFLRTRVDLAAEFVTIGVAKCREPTCFTELVKFFLDPLAERIFEPLITQKFGDDSGEPEWLGRTLDQDRRIKENITKNGDRLNKMIEDIHKSMNSKIEDIHTSMNGKIEETNMKIDAIQFQLHENLSKVEQVLSLISQGQGQTAIKRWKL